MRSETVKITNTTSVNATPYIVAICFENRFAMATKPRINVVTPSPMGISTPPMPDVERKFVFLVVTLVAQHQHAQRFQEEAPHHAERVRFAEQVYVAAAQDDGGQSAAAR